MSDLVLREEDGWDELEDFHENLAHDSDITRLWNAAAVHDVETIGDLLEEHYEFEDDERIVGFKIIVTPDDIHGDFYRAWVRVK